MVYSDGTVTVVSGSSIVKGTDTKWNSNNPLVSPGMLMLIKNGDVNHPYMVLAVNSDTELTLASKSSFSATDTTYTINLTEPKNNSDAARALVAANAYIMYFLQNMDTWMVESGVVEITLPSGKTVKLESIKALRELIEGKADASSVKEIKDALENKADIKTVTEISEKVDTKYDKTGGELTGDVQLNTGKIKSKTEKSITTHTFQNKDGTLMHVGDFGVGIINPPSLNDINVTLEGGFYNAKGDAPGVPSGAGATNFIQSTGEAYCFQIGKENLVDDIKFRIKRAGQYAAWQTFYSTRNVTVDSNGFLKKSSPVVKIYPNGDFETNEESEGVKVQRLGTGRYLIKGVLGYNSNPSWGVNGGISIPKDVNGLALIYVKDKILPDGNIEIHISHRQHPHLPDDFQNWRIKTVIDDNPICYLETEICDIPPSTWLDVRVEMPIDSIWNKKQTNQSLDRV